MSKDDDIYRRLQQHLDDQAVGFPSVKSGADIRILKQLFTPEEAGLALHLTYRPEATSEIAEKAASEFAAERVLALLESMFFKGAIGWKKRDGLDAWFVMGFVIGMYECQDGSPSPEFLKDANEYMKSLKFGRSLIAARPSQMRTIPISKSLNVEHHVATYLQIRDIIADSPGPFVVLPCICRKNREMEQKPCKKTSRTETCLGMGDMASAVLRRGHGREVTRDEVLNILQMNEEDGLVFQPANTQSPEFVCSCCGCCCGMLSLQKMLPRPTDFWSAVYHAEVSEEACSQCGTCVDRCQVNAMSMSGTGGTAKVNPVRCIGCGLCVTTCPSGAIQLKKNEIDSVPPKDEEALLDEIMSNKKGSIGQMQILAKAMLGIRQ